MMLLMEELNTGLNEQLNFFQEVLQFIKLKVKN